MWLKLATRVVPLPRIRHINRPETVSELSGKWQSKQLTVGMNSYSLGTGLVPREQRASSPRRSASLMRSLYRSLSCRTLRCGADTGISFKLAKLCGMPRRPKLFAHSDGDDSLSVRSSARADRATSLEPCEMLSIDVELWSRCSFPARDTQLRDACSITRSSAVAPRFRESPYAHNQSWTTSIAQRHSRSSCASSSTQHFSTGIFPGPAI